MIFWWLRIFEKDIKKLMGVFWEIVIINVILVNIKRVLFLLLFLGV